MEVVQCGTLRVGSLLITFCLLELLLLANTASPDKCAFCNEDPAARIAPAARNIFDQLSVGEYYQAVQHVVWKFGYLFPAGWNISSSDSRTGARKFMAFTPPTPISNYIYSAELFPVSKSLALAYLDSTARRSTAQRSTAQRGTAQRGTAQHGTAKHSTAENKEGTTHGSAWEEGASYTGTSTSRKLKSAEASDSGAGSAGGMGARGEDRKRQMGAGNGSEPPRYARVIVFRGDPKYRDIVEYKVGPLGGSDQRVTAVPLTTPGEISYLQAPFEPFQWQWAVEAATREMTPLKEIWLHMTGGKYCMGDEAPCDNSKFVALPAWNWLSNHTNGRINHVLWCWNPGYGEDAFFLHPMPLTFKLNWTAVDPKEWYAFSFEYCHQYFPTAQDLLAAWAAKSLKTCAATDYSSGKWDMDWARVDNVDSRPPRPGSEVPSARLTNPGGQRFHITRSPRGSGAQFSWLGWEGYVTLSPHTGIQLFDLTFKGERIVYERSLQEQLAQYSGYGQWGQTLFSDTFYKLGSNMQALRPGVDCPETAQYASIVVPNMVGSPVQREQAICFFESDPGNSHWRHVAYDFITSALPTPKHHGTRDTHFVIRVGGAVGNYDYIYDVHFKFNGEIEPKVAMAGYMTTTFNDPTGHQTDESEFFAPRVHKYTRGNMHGHLTNWKVDLDIKGIRNTAYKQSVMVGTYKDLGLEAPGWAVQPELDWPMKYIKTEQMEVEQGYKLHVREPSIAEVRSSKEVVDDLGIQYGYAILLGETSTQLLPDNHPFVTGPVAWSKYHIAFTKHKDAEYLSHDMRYAGANIWASRYNFDTFMTPPDSLDGEDVVVWVSLVKEHIPRREDVPLISNIPLHFRITPWNYFPMLQALEVPTATHFPTCTPHLGDAYNYTYDGQA